MCERKPGWKPVKFGQVVRLNKDRSKDPSGDGLDRYIGLEHIEPGDLRVRSWGDVADGTTFTNRFRPGHVLFGKRRAYQRKIAVADFDGVCSGDIYVFEPKDPTVLLPEVLPFICQTDSFFEHAVRTSAGSLSPRTNWKSIADYEFALPPLNEQQRIVDGLLASERVVHRLKDAAVCATATQNAFIKEVFSRSSDWPLVPLVEVGDLLLGKKKSGKDRAGVAPRPYLRVGNIKDWRVDTTDVKTLDYVGAHFEKYRLERGDILITEGDIVSPYNVGRSALYDGSVPGCCFDNHLFRFRTMPGIDPWFVLGLFRYLHMIGEFAKAAKVTTVIYLGLKRLSQMQVLLPSAELQASLGRDTKAIWDLDSRVLDRLQRAEGFHSRLVQGSVTQ